MHAPRVGHERRADACGARPAHGLDHRLVRLHAREQPVDQAVGLDLEQRSELLLEVALVQLARLERDQQLARGGVAAEASRAASCGSIPACTQ